MKMILMDWLGVLSGLIGIVIGHLLSRTRFRAEILRLNADADKLNMETRKMNTEITASWVRLGKEMQKDIEQLMDQLDTNKKHNQELKIQIEKLSKENAQLIVQIEKLTKENVNLKIEMKKLEALLTKKYT